MHRHHGARFPFSCSPNQPPVHTSLRPRPPTTRAPASQQQATSNKQQATSHSCQSLTGDSPPGKSLAVNATCGKEPEFLVFARPRLCSRHTIHAQLLDKTKHRTHTHTSHALPKRLLSSFCHLRALVLVVQRAACQRSGLTVVPNSKLHLHPLCGPDSPLVSIKGSPLPRLHWPYISCRIKISASARTRTSSTSCLLPPLLRFTKGSDPFALLDSPLNHHQNPEFNPPFQLPHKGPSEPLPLTEGESRRPRQSIEGSVCYRFRPP